jgi:putative transposase
VARALRIEFEGAFYHLCGRGNARQRIFSDDKDCAKFIELLIESLDRYDVAVHAYVLMGNHYHLIGETRCANLGRWMHWLTTAYTVYFNRRHRRVGHLFQGRYKSIVLEAEGYLLSLSRYVHLNPVRGRVIGKGDPVERRKRLRSWRWSSYPGYAGLIKPESWITHERVMEELGGSKAGRALEYRRFVEEGLLREIENPLEAAKWQTALGREEFLRRMADLLQARDKQEEREMPSLRRLRGRPEFEFILERVARKYRCTRQVLCSRGKRGNEARAVAMVLIWDCCGMSLREVGELFGGVQYTAIAQMIARTRAKDAKKGLRFKLSKLLGECQSEDLTPELLVCRWPIFGCADAEWNQSDPSGESITTAFAHSASGAAYCSR